MLPAYQQASDSSGIHKEAARWSIKHFKLSSAAVSLGPRVHHKYGSSNKTEGMLFSWKEVVNRLPETYATDGVIEENQMGMQRFKKPSSMTIKSYAQAS